MPGCRRMRSFRVAGMLWCAIVILRLLDLQVIQARDLQDKAVRQHEAVVDIPAPMSGSVFEVLVSAGATVSAGQEVIVLESMKMEIPVESPEAGVVAEVLVSPEETVEEGQTLLRVES